jgi:hypothetical protein
MPTWPAMRRARKSGQAVSGIDILNAATITAPVIL